MKSAVSFTLPSPLWIDHISSAPSHSGMRLWCWTAQHQSPRELRLERSSETSMMLVHFANGLQRAGPSGMSSCVWLARLALCETRADIGRLRIPRDLLLASLVLSRARWRGRLLQPPEKGCFSSSPLGSAARGGKASFWRPGEMNAGHGHSPATGAARAQATALQATRLCTPGVAWEVWCAPVCEGRGGVGAPRTRPNVCRTAGKECTRN